MIITLCKQCEVKPCACNEKLDEQKYFKKIIQPSIKKLDNLIITDVDEWSRVNLWQTRKPLYFIEDTTGNDGIVLDLKQMQNLARIFDYIIKKELK